MSVSDLLTSNVKPWQILRPYQLKPNSDPTVTMVPQYGFADVEQTGMFYILNGNLLGIAFESVPMITIENTNNVLVTSNLVVSGSLSFYATVGQFIVNNGPIPNDTETEVTFVTDQQINQGGFIISTTPPNTKIIIPSTGIYLVHCNALFLSNSSGNVRYIKFSKNDVFLINATNNPIAGGFGTSVSTFASFELEAGDQLGFVVYQDSGGPLSLFNTNTYIEINKLD